MATLLRNSLLSTATSVDPTNQKPLDVTPPKPAVPDSNMTSQNSGAAGAGAGDAGAGAGSRGDAKPPSGGNLTELKKMYDQLNSEIGQQTFGNDPLIQKNTIDKINKFLNIFPSSKAFPDYKADNAGPWTDLPLKTLYYKTIQTLIDLINDISDIISNMESETSAETRSKVIKSLFQKDRRVYVGIIFIFLSFVLYFIDAAV
jgi:hypothetical protein